MERFNYPSLAAARAESAELLQLLEYESWGVRKDEQEKMDRQQAELDAQRG